MDDKDDTPAAAKPAGGRAASRAKTSGAKADTKSAAPKKGAPTSRAKPSTSDTPAAAGTAGSPAKKTTPRKRKSAVGKSAGGPSKSDMELLEWLETQDPIRRHAVSAVIVRTLFILAVAGAGAATYALQIPIAERALLSAVFFASIALFAAGGIYFVAYEPIRNFRTRIKRAVIPELAARHGLRYETDGTTSPPGVFARMGFVPFHDRAVVDDVFHGEVDGCAVTLIEGRLQVRSFKGWADVFNGLFVDVALPTKIAASVAAADAANAPVVAKRKGFEPFALAEARLSEDVRARFALFAEKTADAKALAEAGFLNALLKLEGALRGVRIQAVVEPDRVRFLVRTHFNFFELGSVRQALAQPETLRHFRADLAVFEEIVATLKSGLPVKARAAPRRRTATKSKVEPSGGDGASA